MKRYALLIISIFFISTAFSQNMLATNPIIYGDVGVSTPITGADGIQFSTSLNYQVKKSLFTLRLLKIVDIMPANVPYSIYAFPGFKNSDNITEAGFLYGWRLVSDGHSFSLSAGVSYSDKTTSYIDNNNQKQRIESRYPGIPFEANVLWFKSRKKRFRIYNIFPVGNPTGFGNSVGVKLSGSLSRYSYLSLGLVLGIGYHKQY